MDKITPSTQSAYDWDYDENETEATVTFPFPKTFNIHSVKAQLIEDDTSILVKAPDHTPFLAGKLANGVTKIQADYNDEENKIVLHLYKKDKKSWNIFVDSKTLTTFEIDPKSAYLMFAYLQKENDVPDEKKQQLFGLLQYSCECGFVPALIFMGAMLLQNPQTEEGGLSYLQMAAQYYQSPQAYYILGIYLIDHQKFEQGVALLQESLSKGFTEAAVILGSMMSPFSSLNIGKKDGKAAIEMLEKAKDNPMAKYEIARIYYNGCDGVPKDVEKAQLIYNEAKKIEPQLAPLEAQEEVHEEEKSSPSKVNKGVVAVIGASIIGLFGFLVFNHIRKHK